MLKLIFVIFKCNKSQLELITSYRNRVQVIKSILTFSAQKLLPILFFFASSMLNETKFIHQRTDWRLTKAIHGRSKQSNQLLITFTDRLVSLTILQSHSHLASSHYQQASTRWRDPVESSCCRRVKRQKNAENIISNSIDLFCRRCETTPVYMLQSKKINKLGNTLSFKSTRVFRETLKASSHLRGWCDIHKIKSREICTIILHLGKKKLNSDALTFSSWKVISTDLWSHSALEIHIRAFEIPENPDEIQVKAAKPTKTTE